MIKKRTLNYLMSCVKKSTNYDNVKLEEIRYGLETLYLNTTKFVVTIIIAILLNIAIEITIFLLFYSIIRIFSGGIHANNSLQCWLISVPLFIIISYFSYIPIGQNLQIIISILSLFILLIYSPADSEKKPLLKRKKRVVLKIFTIIIACIYLLVVIFSPSIIIKNLFMAILACQACFSNPIIYKLFKQKFNNYLYY